MSIISNKILIYLSSRYITYALQFVVSLVIADKLGPYYLGVYGMVQLILSYFDQVNFGIPHSLNVFLVHNKKNHKLQNNLIYNYLVMFTYISFFIVILSAILFITDKIRIGQYAIEGYTLPICLTAILTYYNTTLTTVIRFRNKVGVLSIIGTLPVLANLCVMFLWSGAQLVNALVYSNLVSSIIILCIFYYTNAFPIFNTAKFSTTLQKSIIHKGIYLFLYNSCFYFILISIRTIISSNYSIEEFGFFTFSFTIANAVMLLLNSLNTIIFPKTIDILSNGTNDERIAALAKLRIGYVTSSHLLIYVALIAFPILLLIFPDYKPALQAMNMIALAVLMNANSYGYTTFLIAQNKEKLSSVISLIALLTSIVLGLILVKVFNVQYSYVILSVLVAYMMFSYLATYYASKLLISSYNSKKAIKDFFPIRLLIPYVTALLISILNFEIFIWIPLVVFLLLNYKDLYFLISLAKKLIVNPNLIDV